MLLSEISESAYSVTDAIDDGEPMDVIDRCPESSRTRNCESEVFCGDASEDESVDMLSLVTCIDGVFLFGRSGPINWSTRFSILYRCVPKIDPVEANVCTAGLAGKEPLSSASSLISCSLFEEVDGDAVCRGNEAARDVSFRPSAVVISSNVS